MWPSTCILGFSSVMEDWATDVGATYRKVEVSRPNKGSEAETPEHRYWRRFKTTASHKAYSAVHCVTYNPAAPHDFAATNSTRVQIYGARGKVVKRTISRFKDVVYCASFRRDGKLLAASGEETDVKVFDATSGGMLRLLRGHTKAVHACGFSDDKLSVLSASDDSTVKLWDVATGEATLTMSGHTDHVRSLAPSPASPEIWASGSYDHTVKLWDCRTGESVAQVNHGQPVQATLILPGGGVLVTAGGNIMKVWDILAGGRLIQSVSNHSKPITCLAMDPEGGRVISGSLDHHLKVPPHLPPSHAPAPTHQRPPSKRQRLNPPAPAPASTCRACRGHRPCSVRGRRRVVWQRKLVAVGGGG